MFGRPSPASQRTSSGASAKASPRASESPSPSATSSDCELDAEQRARRTTFSRAPVADDALELAERGVEALLVEDEVGRVLEDAGEEAVQRGLGALAPRRQAAHALRLEVLVEPAGGDQRVRGRQMRRQQRERAGCARG